MSWADVRGKVRDLLSVVAITEPLSETVRTVHEFPPAAIEPGDLPCFLMTPPSRSGSRSSALLQRTYEMGIEFYCRDEKVKDAVNIADAFSEATFTAFENALKGAGVDASLQLIDLPVIEPVSGLQYAGNNYIGFKFALGLRFAAAATPGP